MRPDPARIALLGVGQVGGAFAALVSDPRLAGRFSIGCGLVRDISRERPQASRLHLTSDSTRALDGQPHVVVEALGGLEPARALVLHALERRIPVVTANKSLLAAHGDELLELAAYAGAPLRYEAAVLAGVPFLGTFARRDLARDIAGFCGIVNGTTNFILSTMSAEGTGFAAGLAEAQRRGYAEPDPAKDVGGIDAVEKLCLLLRHFGDWSVRPQEIDADGIERIEQADIRAATDFGGTIKPVVQADWTDGTLAAFCGPAFVPAAHALARIDGVQNALVLRNRLAGSLLFAGPGAGPSVTAATMLDDVSEVSPLSATAAASPIALSRIWKRAAVADPVTGWFVRVSGRHLPADAEIADLLSGHGVWLRRTAEGGRESPQQRWYLTYTCAGPQIAAALQALGAAARCQTARIRVLEAWAA